MELNMRRETDQISLWPHDGREDQNKQEKTKHDPITLSLIISTNLLSLESNATSYSCV